MGGGIPPLGEPVRGVRITPLGPPVREVGNLSGEQVGGPDSGDQDAVGERQTHLPATP